MLERMGEKSTWDDMVKEAEVAEAKGWGYCRGWRLLATARSPGQLEEPAHGSVPFSFGFA